MSKEFWDEVAALTVPAKTVKIEYRLYYDEQGAITGASMQDHKLPGLYIVVTKQEYDEYYHYMVKNGQLEKIDRNNVYSVKLKRSTKGTATVRGHAGLFIEPGEEYPDREYYEYRNN